MRGAGRQAGSALRTLACRVCCSVAAASCTDSSSRRSFCSSSSSRRRRRPKPLALFSDCCGGAHVSAARASASQTRTLTASCSLRSSRRCCTSIFSILAFASVTCSAAREHRCQEGRPTLRPHRSKLSGRQRPLSLGDPRLRLLSGTKGCDTRDCGRGSANATPESTHGCVAWPRLELLAAEAVRVIHRPVCQTLHQFQCIDHEYPFSAHRR